MAHRHSIVPVASLAACLVALASAGPLAAADSPKDTPRPKSPVAPAAGARDARIDLRPRWEPGRVIRYTMKQESSSKVPDAADPKKAQTIKQMMERGIELRCKSVDAASGDATVDMVFTSFKLKTSGNGDLDLDFDSTKPAKSGTPAGTSNSPGRGKPGAPAAPSTQPEDGLSGLGGLMNGDPMAMLDRVLRGMVGATLALTVDRSGKIRSVSGGEQLDPTGMLAQMGGDGASMAPKPGSSLFGGISSSGGTDGFARVGDKWTHRDEFSVGPLGDMTMVTEHHLRSASGGRAELTFKGHAEPSSSASGGKPPAAAQLEQSTQSGSYSWDTERGELIKYTLEQRVTQHRPTSRGQQTGTADSITTMTMERVGR